MRKIFYVALTLLLVACFEDNKSDTEDLKINSSTNTTEEIKLYKLVMEYRKQYKLPSIPLSKSLNIVAKTHVQDLHDNQPVGGKCNLHSWSNKGKWTPVCYTSDHKQAKKMWNKPKELTYYKGRGYEISSGGYGTLTAELSLNSWKGSQGHNDVILNRGSWKDEWKAIGVGMYKGYAVIWFGHQKDTN